MHELLRDARIRMLGQKWAPSVYFIVGQVGWFVCVISAARGSAWIGVSLVTVLVTVHFLRVAQPLEELKLVASAFAIGAAWESALVSFGLLAYPSSAAVHGLAPFWIAALWALFAAQFNTTYRWLKAHIKLAALLGALGGPLSFRAGAALGAVRFVKPRSAAVALVIGWALLLPAVTVLSRRWDGVRQQSV
jgi:Protein of unknown function (DUF2878)